MNALAAPVLEDFAAAVLRHAGLDATAAATLARVLVWADLRGIDSHGAGRLSHYVDFLAKGIISKAPDLRVSVDAGALAVLEADRAAGPVAMTRAADLAHERAKAAGIAAILVRQTTHTAALGCYTQSLARRGMVAIAFNASIPLMAYHGARVAGVSTAPLSIAVPGPDAAPVLLDMATSAIAVGKLAQARRLGTAIGAGLALDRNGNPTTDPGEAVIPLPLGGAKGAGLALMFELVTGALTGNPILADYLAEGGDRRHRQNALVIAIDAFRLAPEADFRRDVAQTVAAIRALPRDAGGAAILVPGERGDTEAARRARDGIPVTAALDAELARLGRAAGVPWPPAA